MRQGLAILCLLLANLTGSGAKADSASGFFGVGLTVQAMKPAAQKGTILRSAVYTPGAVAIGLSAQGYGQVALLSRNPGSYVFSAVSLGNGQRYLLTVAVWGGQIVSAVRA
jgi:hypothetical protein